MWLSMQRGTIAGILGHSPTQVTERYSHLQPDGMERAMEKTFGDSD